MRGALQISVKVPDQFVEDMACRVPLLRQLFVRKIDLRFQQRQGIHQSTPPSIDQTRNASAQLLESPAMLLGRFC